MSLNPILNLNKFVGISAANLGLPFNSESISLENFNPPMIAIIANRRNISKWLFKNIYNIYTVVRAV